MLNKLQVLEDKYKELTEKISDIEVINDQKTWQKYMKEHADLSKRVTHGISLTTGTSACSISSSCA